MELGIADMSPTRKTAKGRPLTITASGSEEQREKPLTKLKDMLQICLSALQHICEISAVDYL